MQKLLILGLFALFLSNCKNDDGPINCAAVSCTEIFVTLNISIKDATGAPVALDRFEVTDISSSENFTIVLSNSRWLTARENGQYPLYDDGYISETQNKTRSLIFKGFVSNEELVNAEFKVTADCCHVSVASGNTDITLN